MYLCKVCKEKFSSKDEVVFFLGEIEVEVSERSPDWDSAACNECHEESQV